MTDAESTARQRIIDTALRLFYEQGFRSTGVNQIIAESNVAKATFYSHFRSKEKLCVAYLQARHELWMSWLEERVERENPGPDQVLGVFDFIREWMSASGFRGCAFLNIASEIPDMGSDIRAEAMRHKDSLRDYIEDLLNAPGGSNSLCDGTQRQEIAAMVYVLVEGAIVACQNYGQTWPVDAARQAAERLLKS
jgi:AcrR family transcriptional regulator